MPLIYIKRYPNGHSVGLYHIEESVHELLHLLVLNNSEEEILKEYTHEEKKKEWCAARILVKKMVTGSGLEYHGLGKDNNGKPTLNNNATEVSISHSFPYVAVIMHPTNPVGIDLEQPKEKLKKIAPRFLNDNELALVNGDLQKLCIMWCAKETLYKIYSKRGLVFREDLKIIPDEPYPWNSLKGIIFDSNDLSFPLRVTHGDNYYMVHNA